MQLCLYLQHRSAVACFQHNQPISALPPHHSPQSDCNRVRAKPRYVELSGKGSEFEQAEAARAYQLSWHDSIVEDLFVGQLQSTITCGSCGVASHCFDPVYSLALPLPARGGPVSVQVGGRCLCALCADMKFCLPRVNSWLDILCTARGGPSACRWAAGGIAYSLSVSRACNFNADNQPASNK